MRMTPPALTAMWETDSGARLLHVVEERRGPEDYGAIPMPGS
jgi:hypothetical protein